MNQGFIQSWEKTIPRLKEILQRMQDKTIIAVGVAPYPRIIPSLFLQNYIIYSVKDTVDLDVLRNYAKVFCLEEKFPKVAQKVHSTSYLLRNYAFQAFLKSRRNPFRLMFYQTTPPIVQALEEQHIDWIGNRPESFDDVLLKANFRNLVKSLKLPHLPDWRLPREEFLDKTFQDIYERWQRPVVAQRGDFDVSGEQGTFFIRNENDWRVAHGILSRDERYKEIQISPFIEGPSVSMLGCITHLGVLTSTLQLQLIDVPEALHGQLPTGVFLGHDWGFRSWNEKVEKTAQKIVESVGGHLAKKGFKGIFGIDLIYDQRTDEIFPLECNPRFTGALPVYSLMITNANQIPPIEFFHIMAHLNIIEDFDFQSVNEKLKERQAVSHISLTPKGAYEMKIPLATGVYSYLTQEKALRYERPGAFLWDAHKDSEFLMIDSMPRLGGQIIQNVPRLFKLIFPRSIATSSFSVDPEVGDLITKLSTLLRKNQTSPQNQEVKVSVQSEEVL
ncbi:MAG: ATP-grasp domain-containing protein [Candidatus Wildermuthbacteria bacterium]|nr:ATP-grasp domain-containing protein [Candidatus Wildermuthbacteria bacterium]